MNPMSSSIRNSQSQPKLAERLQKVLANAGAGSRRQIERWIAEGRIVVNGKTAQLGDRLVGTERVRLDGREIRLGPVRGRVRHEHLAYHKPAHEITTRDDPEGRPTVFESIPEPRHGRWISVGRLDVTTSGLLLLTTDGELAHRLMHPSYEIKRQYAVRLLGTPTDSQLQALRDGVELEDGVARVESIEPRGGSGVNVWYELTLREGRNREVRRLFEALGITVSRLIRIGYGPIALERLRRGQSRFLSDSERAALYAAVGLTRAQRR
jgi:23S rRNA pseudouridine2605 synthase